MRAMKALRKKVGRKKAHNNKVPEAPGLSTSAAVTAAAAAAAARENEGERDQQHEKLPARLGLSSPEKEEMKTDERSVPARGQEERLNPKDEEGAVVDNGSDDQQLPGTKDEGHEGVAPTSRQLVSKRIRTM